MKEIASHNFTWQRWRAGSIHDIGVECRYATITSTVGIETLRSFSVGYCDAEKLSCRPKRKNKAIMCFKDGNHFWFHIRNNEFNEVVK